jgi:heme oxygenase
MDGVALILLSSTAQAHSSSKTDLKRVIAEPSRARYRAWLTRQHAVITPLESALELTPQLGELVDLRARRKMPRLRGDLTALGVAVPTPSGAFLPAAFAAIPAALGWMYAIERATLQFDDAYGVLARALPAEISIASAYLRCYEGHATAMWRALATTIETTCTTRASCDELVANAQAAFRCLRRWSTQIVTDPGIHRPRRVTNQ